MKSKNTWKDLANTDSGWSPPRFFQLPGDLAELETLHASGAILHVHDRIELAIEELYDIEYPHEKDARDARRFATYKEQYGNGNTDHYGSWVFYPWSGEIVHFPPSDDLRSLRTSRNRNLITKEEQSHLLEATIAVVGMSVGSNVIEALLSQAIGGTYIIIDMDSLEPSNLNRIRAPYKEIGVHKVDFIAKRVSEIDPYVKQVHYKNGLDEETLDQIITSHYPDILVDEMDSVAMKIRLRLAAKAAKIPVIMAADDGDGILLDIERYDIENELPILHGNIPNEVMDYILSTPNIPRAELGKFIGRYFVGLENVPLRMFQSLGEVGKSLPSWPQLGGAAALAGITISYCCKKIILQQPLQAGRFLVGPDEQLNPELQDPGYLQKLADIRTQISQQ